MHSPSLSNNAVRIKAGWFLSWSFVASALLISCSSNSKPPDEVCTTDCECVDSDLDSVCDSVDLCAGFDDNGADSDGDGMPNECDRCAFFDDTLDADGDGVPDRCDLCASNDDTLDADADGLPDGCDPAPLSSDWMKVGTVGGLGVFSDIEDSVLASRFDELAAQNVTIVEGDSSLSEYSNDAQFELEMKLLERSAVLAHERGMRLVWYLPSLEVITTNGQFIETSMYKDHPDWVQTSNTGNPNVFYGGLVFWVEDGAESAWMDPLTAYRQYFINRVNRIATTGVDGVWLDVPLYNDIVGIWPSHRSEDKVRFTADTGLQIPQLPADSPAFWRWIRWRHEIIDEFLGDIRTSARAVNPDFNIIVENVTTDNNAAILEGLDGSFGPEREGYWNVWEVDVLSETNSMINSYPDDWISLIAMMKYGRGASPTGSWSFSYGLEPDDAEAVLAACVMTQNNPYELKTPEMTTTVGEEYRTLMFGWIRDHQDLLYRSESAAQVAVLHSSESRDYLDGLCMINGTCGTALFASWERPAAAENTLVWWTNDLADSIYSSNYTAEYKGAIKALSHMHEPFDVLPTSRVDAAQLSRYGLVIAPSLTCLSDAESDVLHAYIQAGGHVLFTGPEVGTRDESALLRGSGVLADVIDATTLPELCTESTLGSGGATYCSGNPGQEYFTNNASTALDTFKQQVQLNGDALVTTNAPTTMHMELYRRGDRLALQTLNYSGADGTFTVAPASIHASVDVSQLPAVSRVIATSPHGSEVLPFVVEGSRISFDMTLASYQMILIEP